MIETTALKNGLTVISDAMPGFETVALGFWVDAGARDEQEAQNGLSHMLEHMAFKGTKTRDAFQIAECVEARGGVLNAYTSREQTCYFVRLLKEDLELGLDLLSDILLNSTFPDEEIAREQQVIAQEIGQSEDTPDDILFDHLQEISYPGQSFGRPILGTEALVRGYGAADLNAYMGAHYFGANMVLVASGAVDHEALVRLAEKLCSFDVGTRKAKALPQFGAGARLIAKPLEQAHLALAFEGRSVTHPHYWASQVLATILGGGMSSRLFQEVRERHGLAYSVSAWAAPARDCGQYGVYVGTSEDDLPKAISLIGVELRKAREGFEENEIAAAKAQLKAGLMMALEAPANRAEQWARQWLTHGRIVPMDEIIGGIDAVHPAELIDASEELLSAPPAIAMIGALGEMADEAKARAVFG